MKSKMHIDISVKIRASIFFPVNKLQLVRSKWEKITSCTLLHAQLSVLRARKDFHLKYDDSINVHAELANMEINSGLVSVNKLSKLACAWTLNR